MIEKWEDRLAAMDHRKGTTDKMRKAAMLAEIKELRVEAKRALVLMGKLSEARVQRDAYRSAAEALERELNKRQST